MLGMFCCAGFFAAGQLCEPGLDSFAGGALLAPSMQADGCQHVGMTTCARLSRSCFH
jgi:hypothetical protein